MRKTFNLYTVIAVAAIVALLGFAAGGGLNTFFAERPLVKNAYAAARGLRGLPDFVSLAKKLTPVVVNVSTTSTVGSGSAGGPNPFSRRGDRGNRAPGQGDEQD